jgi:hypothetical protein
MRIEGKFAWGHDYVCDICGNIFTMPKEMPREESTDDIRGD